MEFLTEELIVQKSSQELTALLYEGLLTNLYEAIDQIDEPNLFQANKSLQRASDIVHRLGVGLRYEAGPITENLDTLYNFLADELIRVNLTKNTDSISFLIKIVETLSTAWNDAMQLKNNAKADSLIKMVSAYENNVMRKKF
ncbi:flagellar export chaperone FliS [Bacillus sp. D386]|uniref:flagellar export chaperone FliS n=1 Tax=Bacillus sp. D386 TaxID=2587155 RepID=UPI001124516A|nr:flagellar export chaperone FliS [Bacillus sp. D386]